MLEIIESNLVQCHPSTLETVWNDIVILSEMVLLFSFITLNLQTVIDMLVNNYWLFKECNIHLLIGVKDTKINPNLSIYKYKL